MRIRTHLVLMACATLLPVVLAAGLALERIRAGEQAMALRGLRETVRATALIVDREAQGALSALKVLGNSAHFETRDFGKLYAQAKALNQLPDVWTLLLDEHGVQLINTGVAYGTPLPGHETPERAMQVKQILASRQPMVTDLRPGPVSGKLRISIDVPVFAPDGRQYVLAQAFALNHWKKTVLQTEVPADWIIAVIDREGNFIARSHLTDRLLGKPARPELVSAASKASEGLIEHSTVEGVRSFDAFSHSSLTGWTVAVAAPVASINAAANRALLLALGGLLLALAAALWSAAIFGRRLVRAIERAGAGALAMGRGETPRVEPSAVDEVNVLNRHLLEADKLLRGERESRRAAEAERERLLHNETQARETAQAQNTAKDQFLAMLGHELRNPLAAIEGATGMLRMGSIDPERDLRAVKIIQRQNRHLSHIVNDLLDASRLMAGKIVLDKQPLNLAECVNHCVDALRASERAQGYRIEVQAREVWVEGDAVRIEQILNNLITNALKFSAPGGTVEVAVHAAGSDALVSVRDWGAGMSAELLPHIFEPFVQGPPPVNRTQSGMGIGLALVQQLVALHGGSVEAASPGPDRGSSFTLRFPAIQAPRSQ